MKSLKQDLFELGTLIDQLPDTAKRAEIRNRLTDIKMSMVSKAYVAGYADEKTIEGLTGNVFKDLNLMHTKFGFYNKAFTKQGLRQRIDFLQEELDEIKKGFDDKNAEEIVDGLIDLKVVASGTLDFLKVDGQLAWFEVMNANMAKTVGFNEKRPNSQGNDLIKPEGWKPPNHSRNVGILPEILNQKYDFQYGSNKEVKPNLGELNSTKRRFAIDFLEHCKSFMLQKANDYNNEKSSVKSADYYLRGADDLLFNLREKYLRITSVLDILRSDGVPNFDSLQDSFRDLCIFSAMFAEWCAGKMDGQDTTRDIFNRPIQGAKN